MTTQITDRLDNLIAEALASGDYDSAEDFMTDLGHAVADHRSREKIRKAWLRASIHYADAQGGGRPFEEVFERVYARIDAIAEQKCQK